MIKFELPAALRDTLSAALTLGEPGPTARAPRPTVEPLEARRLLTRLSGGGLVNGVPTPEIFEFQSPNGAVRVVVSGNVEIDLIGATQDVRGNAILNPVPGVIDSGPRAGTDLFGGFGGADGIEPVDVAFPGENESFTDVSVLPGRDAGDPQSAGTEFVTIDALATNADGKTYGLNLYEVDQGAGTGGGEAPKVAQLLSIDRSNGDATAVADLADRIVQLADFADTGNAESNLIGEITAADFSPDDPNLLYFVATVSQPEADEEEGDGGDGGDGGGGDGGGDAGGGGGGGGAGDAFPLLYVYDLSTDELNVVGAGGGAFTFGSTADTPTVVGGLTFTSDGNLVAFVTAPAVGEGEERVGLVEFSPASPALGFVTPVAIDGEAVTDVNSIEILPGSDDEVFAVVDTDAVLIDRTAFDEDNNARALVLGGLVDPDDDSDNPPGANIGDVTYHPTIPNPFLLDDGDPDNDDDLGALIGTDTETDQLLFIDTRNRFPVTDLYNVVIVDGDSSGSVVIAAVPDRDVRGRRDMDPFGGTAPGFTVRNAIDGEDLDVSPDGGTGALLLGLIRGGEDVDDEEVGRPFETISSSTYTEPTAGYTLPAELFPGVRAQADIGKFLFGGTILGRVDSSGSIGTFYAGQVLTGDANGIGQFSTPTNIDNFAVRGDLRNLVTVGSIGTAGQDDLEDAEYNTGFQLAVGGDLGEVSTRGQFYGAGGVLGTQAGVSKIVANQFEIEGRNRAFRFDGVAFQAGELQNGAFNNDTFDTAQFLGSFRTRDRNFEGNAVVTGNLDNLPNGPGDGVDYYAAGLLAGDTVEVELESASGISNVGVFDPDGRLIATNYGRNVRGGPFRFTAVKPGAYRFAVAINEDTNFDGSGTTDANDSYTLRLAGLGRIALGGLVARGDVVNPDTSVPLRVFGGDFGALEAGGEIESPFVPLRVDRGNLRSVVGEELGRSNVVAPGSTEYRNGPSLAVPRGTVGLIRATDPDGVLSVNPGLVLDGRVTTTDPLTAAVASYQVVDAANALVGNYVANGGIGTVRGRGSIAALLTPTAFIADADNFGQDGTIDLIDSGGDIGTLQDGGPVLATGVGGNVRYMRAAPGGIIYPDPAFGGGNQQATRFSAGRSVTLTDDSGTQVTFRPTPTDEPFNPGPADPGGGGQTPTNENPDVVPLPTGGLTPLPFDPGGGGTTPTNENPDVNPESPLIPERPEGGGNTPTNENPPVDPENPTGGEGSPPSGNPGTGFPGFPGFPNFPDPALQNNERITATTYPVRGTAGGTGGGSVILRVESTGGIDVQSAGGPGTSVEISELVANGIGTPVAEVPALFDERLDFIEPLGNGGLNFDDRITRSRDRLIVPATPGELAAQFPGGFSGLTSVDADVTTPTPSAFDGLFQPVDAGDLVSPVSGSAAPLPQLRTRITGDARVDVLRVNGGFFTEITNETDGEIATVDAQTVGDLVARNVGLVVPRGSRAAVRPIALVEGGGTADAFPFLEQTTGVVATRVANVRADSVGNLVVRGDVGTITANAFSDRQRGRFDGIAGAVFVNGNIGQANVGRGILSSGTGDGSDAGLYATGVVGRVRGSGLGNDVRGNIVGSGGIGSVRLDGGAALVGAQVSTRDDPSDTRAFSGSGSFTQLDTDTLSNPNFAVGEVVVNGPGGILNSIIAGANVGPVRASGGFGILGSAVTSTGVGTVQSVEADGLGIRGTVIFSGSQVNRIVANGDGNLLDLASFTPSVRQSATLSDNPDTGTQFDVISGAATSIGNDLLTYLGVDQATGAVRGVTNAGVIENLVASGTRDLGLIRAYQITGDLNRPLASLSGFRNPEFGTRLTFGGDIDELRVDGPLLGVEVTAGGIDDARVGGNIFEADIRTAGELRSLRVGGSILDGVGLGVGTSIRAEGPNGRIGRIGANGDILGEIAGTQGVREVVAGRDLGTRRLFSQGTLGRLAVGRDVLTGTRVDVRGTLADLFVGDDVESGAIIRAARFGEQTIRGTVAGAIVTA